MMKSEPNILERLEHDNDQMQISRIIHKSKFAHRPKYSIANRSDQTALKNHRMEVMNLEEGEDQLDEIELEMLVEECEELIYKISPSIHHLGQEQTTMVSDFDYSFTNKKEMGRLESEHLELCLEIERQQKELQNFRFKVQIAQKQAEHYTREIKEKTAILQNLQQYSQAEKKGRQSFRK